MTPDDEQPAGPLSRHAADTPSGIMAEGLGACNPPLAHRALSADRRIGLLLPCNVVIRTEAGQTVVEALDPQAMVAVTGEPSLQPVADEAARLQAALDSLQDGRAHRPELVLP